MRFCSKHWSALRTALEARGLTHLIAQGGREALARTTEELRGREAPYDPLMSCHWMISNKALELGGLYLMTGDYCPICEVMKHMAGKPGDAQGRVYSAEEIEQSWIDGPAEAALTHCREHALL